MSAVVIFITMAKNPSESHPFAVKVADGQECTCRSLRDCLICASGAQTALIAVGSHNSQIVWDDRLVRP